MTTSAAQIQKIRTRMERATERARKAAEDEARAALRHIADVAEALVPTATHVVLTMGDAYENPVYSAQMLINADAPDDDFSDPQVAWVLHWRDGDEVRDLLTLVQIDNDNAKPLTDLALANAEGRRVIRGAYLTGDDPIVIPLAAIRN